MPIFHVVHELLPPIILSRRIPGKPELREAAKQLDQAFVEQRATRLNDYKLVRLANEALAEHASENSLADRKNSLKYLTALMTLGLYAGMGGCPIIHPPGQKVKRIRLEAVGDCFDGMRRILYRGKWGFADMTGEVKIGATVEGTHPALKYRFVGDFCEGRAPFSNPEEITYGFLNLAGREIIPPDYDRVNPFSAGMASVNKGDQALTINKNGNKVQRKDGPFVIINGVPRRYMVRLLDDDWRSNHPREVARIQGRQRAREVTDAVRRIVRELSRDGGPT